MTHQNYLNLPPRKPRIKKDMAEYLKTHYGYGVGGGFYVTEVRFAHNVKITHLPIHGEVETACYETLEDPFVWQLVMEPIFNHFADEHKGWYIYSEGRSAGYLTLAGGGSVDRSEDYAKWTRDDLRSLVNVVWDFDQACEEAVEAFINYATYEEEEPA